MSQSQSLIKPGTESQAWKQLAALQKKAITNRDAIRGLERSQRRLKTALTHAKDDLVVLKRLLPPEIVEQWEEDRRAYYLALQGRSPDEIAKMAEEAKRWKAERTKRARA